MFEHSEMLYLCVETPLHAGSGTSIGVVDLPIQRERTTDFPVVQASGLKGKLRSEAYQWEPFVTRKNELRNGFLSQLEQDDDWKDKPADDTQREAEKRARKAAAKQMGLEVVFGPEGDQADLHAGALSPGDARLLLFPVRSLIGVYAWTTCRTVLARFKRDLDAAKISVDWSTDQLPDDGHAWTVDDESVAANGSVVLEEFAFPVKSNDMVGKIANWLADNAFPKSKDYEYFAGELRKRFVILPEDAFRDFTKFSTEVITRIRINQETRTVDTGALWTEEHLPTDTVLYSPLHASRPRTVTDLFHNDAGKPSAQKIVEFVRGLNLDRIQLGGDETVGRGIVKLHLSGGTPQ